MLKHFMLGFVALLPLSAGALPIASTHKVELLGGVASLDKPVSSGSMTISSGSQVLQTIPAVKFVNGTFFVPLNVAAYNAFLSGDVRVTIKTHVYDDLPDANLMADVHQLDAGGEVIRLDPVSSIMAAYRDLKPSASVAEARLAVSRALGVGPLRQCPHVIDFDSESFLQQSDVRGGFDSYVSQVAGEIASGSPPSVPKLTRSQMAERARALFRVRVGLPVVTAPKDVTPLGVLGVLLKELCDFAIGSNPVGQVTAGWLVDQILNGSSGQDQSQQFSELDAELSDVLFEVNQVEKQIADLEQELSKEIDTSNYDRAVGQINDNITRLLTYESDLEAIASASAGTNGPPDDYTKQYTSQVQGYIAQYAESDLGAVRTAVEGNPDIHSPGILELWEKLIASRGAPIFTDNTYLKQVTPVEQYFYGLETIGFSLEMENIHYESRSSPNSPLVKENITRFYNDFNSAHDTEMKQVAQNQQIANSGYYASRAWPDLPELPAGSPDLNSISDYYTKNFDNYTIDTRTGLLWYRYDSRALYQAYPDANGNIGNGLISDVVGQVNSVFDQKIVAYNAAQKAAQPPKPLFDVTLSFNAPTRNQFVTLADNTTRGPNPTPGNPNNDPAFLVAADWLNNEGFSISDTTYSEWTSEVAQRKGTQQIFPNWDNWLYWLGSEKGEAWYLDNGDPNEPQKTGYLMLVSDAPLNTVNQQVPTFLYKEGQDQYPLCTISDSGQPSNCTDTP
jgi:hypothetical protein